MKNTLKLGIALAVLCVGQVAQAQQPEIQYFRYRDARGLNVFETSKKNTVAYDGMALRIGGNFTQQFQALRHTTASPIDLYKLSPGFNVATANLNFDIQLEDGIRVALENYMSSRHHNEFWVKGGYIQMDKLPMIPGMDWFDKYLTVKIGHYMPNYGDMHFRRTDNGNALHNPFVGNTLMDAFTTEIGGDLRFESGPFFAVAGMTGGLISGDVQDKGYFKAATATDSVQIQKMPSFLGKIGFDKQFVDDIQVRLTASAYHNPTTSRNTLYAGDRTGSRYYLVIEPVMTSATPPVAVTATSNFTSGRINPGFTTNVTSFMVNPFIKIKGLELFGMYELSSGYNMAGDAVVTDGATSFEKRTVNQWMGEAIYRFADDQFYLGGRYNIAQGQFYNGSVYDKAEGVYELGDQTATRLELAGGWFMTPSILLKASYVNQDYTGFDQQTAGALSDIRSGANFNGAMIEAVIGF
jgi:hypothetical protein